VAYDPGLGLPTDERDPLALEPATTA
jgi:hypothetical protein